MKILLISDSHGQTDIIFSLAVAEQPEAILHMGDGEGAFEELVKRLKTVLPDCECHNVCGNCDNEGSAPYMKTVVLAGKRLFMIHGHQYGEIKQDGDYSRAVEQAKKNHADILLCGHTHSQVNRKIDGMLVVNPGAAIWDKYAIAVIGDDGEFSVSCTGGNPL